METSKKTNLRLLVVVTLLVVGAGFYVLYKYDITNPNRVFYGMIENNLNTRSYVATEVEEGITGNILQKTLVETGQNNLAESSEVVNLTGTDSGQLKTLGIGTLSTDYSSYTEINTNQTGVASKYSSILGQWGVNSPDGPSGQGGQLFASNVLSPFLFASPSVSDTNTLMNFIKVNKVYTVTSKSFSRFNGRSVINYSINLNLNEYTKLLNLYSKMIGYKNSSKASYSAGTVAQLKIAVDEWSRDLISLNYPGTYSLLSYSSYGINPKIVVPAKTIPLNQLKNEIINLSSK